MIPVSLDCLAIETQRKIGSCGLNPKFSHLSFVLVINKIHKKFIIIFIYSCINAQSLFENLKIKSIKISCYMSSKNYRAINMSTIFSILAAALKSIIHMSVITAKI